jgi:hypothetical protein
LAAHHAVCFVKGSSSYGRRTQIMARERQNRPRSQVHPCSSPLDKNISTPSKSLGSAEHTLDATCQKDVKNVTFTHLCPSTVAISHSTCNLIDKIYPRFIYSPQQHELAPHFYLPILLPKPSSVLLKATYKPHLILSFSKFSCTSHLMRNAGSSSLPSLASFPKFCCTSQFPLECGS